MPEDTFSYGGPIWRLHDMTTLKHEVGSNERYIKVSEEDKSDIYEYRFYTAKLKYGDSKEKAQSRNKSYQGNG